MAFTFKQFHVDDYGCGMPVSTDGVLLGAWAPLSNAEHILDIGAGSGLLSLMAAQRSQARVTSVELDDWAVDACQKNFTASPWSERLFLEHASVQSFCTKYLLTGQPMFEHIICNPPYFKAGPQSRNRLRALARHTDSLGFGVLLETIGKLLAPDGEATLILPSQSMGDFRVELARSGLRMSHLMDISDSEAKPVHRHLFTLCHEEQNLPTHKPACVVSRLCIKDRQGNYTEQMRQLITDFYLKY